MKKLFLILFFLSFDALAKDLISDDIFNSIEDSFEDAKISNSLVVDLNYDNNYEASNPKEEFRQTNARARFYSGIRFNDKLSFNTQINLSPFNKNSTIQRRDVAINGGGDRSFEDQGIFVRQFYLKYQEDNYTLIAGKINLAYGNAWRWDRGIWTFELANNYRQVDKIGAGGVYKLGDAKTTGQYNFGFNFFKNDSKYIDNALIASDNGFHKSDNRAGDDNFFNSYMAALDIKFDFGREEKLSYHFNYLNLSVNENFINLPKNQIKDQKGFVLGVMYKYPVSKNYHIDSLIEYSKMKNLNGNSNLNERFFTANIINRLYKNWNVTIGYSNHESNLLRRNGYDQDIKELSFGYEFKKNKFFDRFLIQTGYKNMRNDFGSNTQENHALGFLLRYYKSF